MCHIQRANYFIIAGSIAKNCIVFKNPYPAAINHAFHVSNIFCAGMKLERPVSRFREFGQNSPYKASVKGLCGSYLGPKYNIRKNIKLLYRLGVALSPIKILRYWAHMPRFALKIEYHGEPFSGWQRQDRHASVQQSIEEALGRLEPGSHRIAAAGRTDAGVHAVGQVAHCDLKKDWDNFRLSEALNFHLKPHPIAITNCAEVSDDWHARFSAVERYYIFRLLSRRAPATYDKGLVWHVTHDLDVTEMQKGAQFLLGSHDFTTFRSSTCQAQSPIKTLDVLDVEKIEGWSGTEFRFHVKARSFLHNQVRSFVGTLERVGAGHWSADDVKEALDAKDRSRCGPVCPPQGLYLNHVFYEHDPF